MSVTAPACRTPVVFLLLVALVAGPACGARLTDEQRRTALASLGSTSTAASESESGVLGEAELDPSQDPDVADLNADSARGDRRGAQPAGSDRGAPSASRSAAAISNGGATDVGVTATEVAIGNVSTVGGPVPGLFAGAQKGIGAFTAYVNATGGIHGRKLKLVAADDGLDANQNRTLTADLEKKVLAFVASQSTRDNGGASVLAKTGVPDIGLALSFDRGNLANSFSPDPVPPDGTAIGPPNYFKARFPGAEKKAALIWVNDPASRDIAQIFKKVWEAAGFEFVYTYEAQVTEPSYTGQVLRMRDAGVRYVLTTLDTSNASRLAKAIQQQGFKVEVPHYGPQVYSQTYLDSAGPAAEGTITNLPHALFEDTTNKEMVLFLEWLRRSSPGFVPDLFALYGWASGRLFVDALSAAGPRATRAGVLGQLRKTTRFDSRGLIAPADPANKVPPTCFTVARVVRGAWVRDDPASGYICDRGGYHRFK